MSKLKLNLRNLEGAEVLTREQLKKIVGGDSASENPNPACNCDSDAQCSSSQRCGGLCNGSSYLSRCIDKI